MQTDLQDDNCTLRWLVVETCHVVNSSEKGDIVEFSAETLCGKKVSGVLSAEVTNSNFDNAYSLAIDCPECASLAKLIINL